MGKLENQIDSLFAGDRISDATAERIFDRLLANYEECEKKSYQRLFALVLIWLLGIGIQYGMFEEASFLGTKLKDLSSVLFGLPFLSAVLFYGLVTSLAAMGSSLFAMRQFIKNHKSKVHNSDLEYLIVPLTFFSIEILTYYHSEGMTNKVQSIWLVTTMLLTGVGCVAIIIHLSIISIA